MSSATRTLGALGIGLALGIAVAEWSAAAAQRGIAVAEPVGTLWLNGLRMTVVPLVVALLVTGIAATAEAARAGRLAARAVLTMLAILWASAIMAALVTPALLQVWPLPAEAAAALRAALAGAAPVGEVPGFGAFVAALVPTNPIDAAAKDSFLPLIVFTGAFGFAVTRLPAAPRRRLTEFFQAIVDAMLVVIGWVLWLAPIGVFALAYLVGARAGTAAFGALVHYILIVSAVGALVWLASFPLGALGGRVPLGRFVRATGPAQAVAISTQSSLASLPAMLQGAERLGVPVTTAGVVLPLAVAIFRATGPAMNVAVAIYVCHWFGVELTATTLAAGVAVAATTTLGSVSLPGSISFIAAIAPIALAMGAPVEALGLLVAVETIPDIMRTMGNVTMDLAVTKTVAERSEPMPATEADRILEEAA